MELEPGVLHAGTEAGWTRPIAIVGDEAAVRNYLAVGPIGPYVIVRELAHLPADVELRGLAVLGTEPMPDDLRDALVQALLMGR